MARRSLTTVLEESNENALNSTGSSGNILDHDPSAINCKKRYMVFRELLETEQNYVHTLRSIIEDYKEHLERLDEHERETILSKREMHVLFAKVEPLLELHQSILAYFERENQAWTGKNLIGFIYRQENERLLKCYKSYCNNYNEILNVLKAVRRRPTLCQFFETCQMQSGKRFNLSDMLIRPIQRLPSVILLLKQLQKATSKSNQDHPCILVALQTVDEVLNKSNSQCKNIDSWQLTLQTINIIEGFPSDHIHSNQSILAQADFQLVHSNGSFKRFRGSFLTLFLFNDFVVVTKRRDKTSSARSSKSRFFSDSRSPPDDSVSILSHTLSRSESFSTLKKGIKRSLSFISDAAKLERKPFKFLEILFFTSFRQFLFTRQDGLFYLKLRDEMSDEMCTLKVAGDSTVDTARNLMATLCDQINGTSKREVILLDVSEAFMNLSQSFNTPLHPDEMDYITKTRKRLSRC